MRRHDVHKYCAPRVVSLVHPLALALSLSSLAHPPSAEHTDKMARHAHRAVAFALSFSLFLAHPLSAARAGETAQRATCSVLYRFTLVRPLALKGPGLGPSPACNIIYFEGSYGAEHSAYLQMSLMRSL